MNTATRCILLALVLFGSGARAETYLVTRFDDPLPSTCTPQSCSLREAAQAAGLNDEFGPSDRIVLGTGRYTLVRGELPVARQGIEVVGAGSAQTEIATDAIVFTSGTPPRQPLTLRGLRLVSSGISVLSARHAVLHDVLVPVDSGQVSFSGDTVDVQVYDSEFRDTFRCNTLSGSCTIVRSKLFNLYVIPQQGSSMSLLLQHSTIDGDLDPEPVLASNISLQGGTIVFEDSTITHSVVSISTDTTLRRVRYLDNADPVISLAPTDVLIEDSEFRGNQRRALRAANGAQWVVQGSSFIDNLVDGNAGGAVLVEDDAELRIRNSTFAGNSFSVGAAADGARGAAIGYRNNTAGARLILSQVTIAAPAALPDGIEGSALGGRGSTITVDVSNSILAGSCRMDAGVLQNNAGNIESPAHGCGLDSASNRVDVSAAALALSDLGDYGGATPTMPPDEDSVAIDRASGPQCLERDQRGYRRPFGGGCDVGAVELGADDALFADGFD